MLRPSSRPLNDEIHGSPQARYEHRLHAVFMVAKGMSCRQVARYWGDSPQAVTAWLQQFRAKGVEGLREGERAGRPQGMTKEQVGAMELALRQSPRKFGLDGARWSGKLLSAWLDYRFQFHLALRQCQRMLQQRRRAPSGPKP